MQNICLLFSGRRGLEDHDMRMSVLRIPEVSRKLKELQKQVDQFFGQSLKVDLFSIMQSPENEFNSQSSLASLLAGTVQIGLFERYVKYRSRPQFLVGPVNGTSAMRVCSGLLNFQDYVETSDFCRENTLMARLNQQGPQLAGVKLEEYGALWWNPEGFYQTLEIESKQAMQILDQLNLNHLLSQCIHIGPCFEFRAGEWTDNGLQNLPAIGSIEIDPILNSFWKAAI